MAEEFHELKITLITDIGKSIVSGIAYPVSTPFNYPQPYVLRFQNYKMVGPILTHKEFKVITGKIEYQGEEFDIPPSKGSWEKFNKELMDVIIYPSRPPKKVFHY
ncbi:hypothetical protein ACTFIW_011708 [Dictyostelium discoideum]